MAEVPAIAFEGVSKIYPGAAVPALSEVSLEVPAGQFLAVVGASGSGKTTLLKLVNRLAEPDAGEVRVGGTPVREGPPQALRRRIGYVFQGVGLFPHLSVGDNIAVTPRLLRWPEAEVRARVEELLALAGFPPEVALRRPDTLSGGQRQRIGLARALAARPATMLLDEPFGALDPITRDRLGRDYRALHEALGLTTLMITHDMAEALLLADEVAVMDQGRLVARGPPARILEPGQPAAVRDLVETPRRQAEALARLIGPTP